MSNSYFRFKQFNINQQDCAMKVTTDACIQGAWTPTNNAKKILDIGAGTGLLSLMMAQRAANAQITAAELDITAAKQAGENVSATPWNDRVQVIQTDIRIFESNDKYDLIISNPPFFNNSLLSDKDARNKARHTASLSYDDLFNAINLNMSETGIASVLLPRPESDIWEDMIGRHGWHIHRTLLIKHTEGAAIKRVVLIAGRRPAQRIDEVLTIKLADGDYTPDFKQLLAPFYLLL